MCFAMSCAYVYYQNFKRTYIFEIPLIFLFLTLFLLFFISAFDFISVLFCTEGITFALTTLIIYNSSIEDSSFAAMKYLILGSLAAGLFGFGTSLLFAVTGETDFFYIHKYLYLSANKQLNVLNELDIVSNFKGPVSLLAIAVIFIFFGFFFKLAVAPMHQ